MQTHITTEIDDKEWLYIAGLIAEGVPNSIISKVGNRFGAAFYSKLVEQKYSCGYVARDASDNIVGVIIGTTDYPKARSIAFKGQLVELIIGANFRLLSWSVISWVIKEIIAKISSEKDDRINTATAELVAIAVCPEAKGAGLARKLVEEMEKFMISKGLSGPYIIRTEKANTRANKFYEKIGATFVKTNLHHGKDINEWHKEITSVRGNDR